MINQAIRADIIAALANGARVDTRLFTATLSQRYSTTRQRVCGNLSFLKRIGALKIYSNRPHSMAFI